MQTDSTKVKLSLIILMMIIGLLLINSSILAGDLKLIHDKKFEASNGGILNLKSAVGDVNIQSWSNSEVSVKVFGNEKAAKELEFSFSKTGQVIKIKAEKESINPFKWLNNVALRYEIKVPKEFQVEIFTAGGDVNIDEINGKFDVNTSGGDIKMQNNLGNIFLKTSGGDIEVKNHKGNVNAETSGGDIKMQIVGNVNCSTSGGDIDLITENGKVIASTSGGDVTLKYWGENKGIELGTSGGDIKCLIPSSTKANVELRTFGGEINLDFSNSSTTKIKSSRYEGKFNGGGAELICKTSGGNISVSEVK